MGEVLTGGLVSGLGGGPRKRDSRGAAMLQARYLNDAEDYLRERNELPSAVRDSALESLAGEFGLPGFGNRVDFTDQIMRSPIYQSMIDQIEFGIPRAEDAILRNASATGMLRSGDSISDIAELNQNAELAKSQTLGNLYQNMLSGFGGLAATPTQDANIANLMTQQGQVLGQGAIGALQTEQAANQAQFNNILGLGQLGIGAMAFSDVRLKENIEHVGEVGGHRWYSWDWNEEAAELGLSGRGEGVMAHEVADYKPEAISEEKGYMVVNYDMLEVH
jgi:hypothetical protein